ncbi:MAG TPA: S-layer homology domain-containing protein [Thermoanaerobaculia bacterium]|nr:S-layer homology domain-containing protein [Thermoanaerobaculia bacterium]
MVGACLATPLFAAAPVFTNNFTAVSLDGVRLGTDTDPSNYSMFPSVVFDPSSGLFQMWVANTSALSIEGLRHATSTDGVHFISDGNLSFAGGSPFPAYGAATEPQFEFPRAAKIGSDWKLLIWTENNPSVNGDYNYNESVNDIGLDPSTLVVTHQGPIFPADGTGTFGQTTGPYGIVNGKLYVEDDRIGGLSKWEYNDAAPPSVTPPADHYQDLIAGTGYVYFLTNPGNPLGVYVHNVARVLDQGDGTLGVYYSLRFPDGSRVNKQIYYAESGDGGQTWSVPVGLFSNGDAIRVNGTPSMFDFSHPEVTLAGSRRVLYFSTKAADGAFVVATSAGQPPPVNSWADLLGSGQGPGESGVAAVRASDGGYAVLARSQGFFPDDPAFWLVKLDGSGEVVSQRAYSAPSTGAGSGSTFFPTALTDAGDGGFVMAGYTDATDGPIWIVRVNGSGSVVWSKTYLDCNGDCGDRVASIIRTSDGGFAFAASLGVAGSRLGIGKIDATGALQWIYSYPIPAESSAASSLIETPGGGLAVGASFNPGFGVDNFRVLRTDGTGTTVWDARVGSGAEGKLSAIANFSSGGFLVAGTDAAGFTQVAALDDSGTIQWQNTYTGAGFGTPTALVITPEGGAGIAGFGASDPSHATMLQIGPTGAVEWAKTFAAEVSSHTSFNAIVSTHDGGLLVAGSDASSSVPFSQALVLKVDAGGAFIGCLDVETSLPIAVSTPALFSSSIASVRVDEMSNTTVADTPATSHLTDAAGRIICRATLPADLAPVALAADQSGNGVADPGESFVAAPAWENDGLVATLLTGHASPVSDSNGLDTSDPDIDANYGTVPSLSTSDCQTATGDCYHFRFQDIPRPSQHWDTSFDETLTTPDPHHRWAKRWTLHAGLSFSDVSPTNGFYRFVEDIFHNGITGGCGAGIFCPTEPVTRAQMSVFLLKSKHGELFVPPVCTGIFSDVPCPSLFADWIEELAGEGITAGCGGGNYCPNDAVTRQQMAVFLLKALNGSGYVPPACAGIFGDVACPSQFAAWVEDLYDRQITAGCSVSPLLYCPTAPNTREQMAVFLTKTFSLVLYGP